MDTLLPPELVDKIHAINAMDDYRRVMSELIERVTWVEVEAGIQSLLVWARVETAFVKHWGKYCETQTEYGLWPDNVTSVHNLYLWTTCSGYLLNYSSIDHTPSLNKVVSKWTCNPYLMPEYDVVIFRHDEGDGEL